MNAQGLVMDKDEASKAAECLPANTWADMEVLIVLSDHNGRCRDYYTYLCTNNIRQHRCAALHFLRQASWMKYHVKGPFGRYTVYSHVVEAALYDTFVHTR